MNKEHQENFIQLTIDFVKSELKNAEGGHDWWHIYRVWKTAKQIALKENADLFIVELGALLHDIADSKFNDGNEVFIQLLSDIRQSPPNINAATTDVMNTL